MTQSTDTPTSAVPTVVAKRPRVHHAWWVALAGGIVFFVSSGLGGYLLGVFQPAWLDEFGWPATWLSLAFAIGSLLPGLTGVQIGRWTDRYGPRGIILGGALVTGLSYFLLASVESFPMFCLAFGIGALGRCGLSNIPVSTAITRWFATRRAMALGLTSTGISLAGVVLVPLGTFLIVQYGWRTTVAVFGVGVWVLIIPIAYFVMGGSPAERGVTPYGGAPATATTAARPKGDATLSMAMRDVTFWLIAAGQMLGHAGGLSIGVHAQKAIIDKGVSPQEAAAAVSLLATCALLSRFLYAWLGEFWPAAPLLAATFVGQGLGFVLLAATGAGFGIYLFAIVFGLTLGGSVSLQSIVVADIFGVKGFGAILGALALPSSLVSAASPVIAAGVRDLTGSYAPAFLWFGVAAVLGAGTLMLAYRRTRNLVGGE